MFGHINDNLVKVLSSFHNVKVFFWIKPGTVIILQRAAKLGCTKILSELKSWAYPT